MPKKGNALRSAIQAAQLTGLSSKARIESFVCHVYLVMLGIRDGYLVDEFSADVASMVSLVESFVDILGSSKSIVIICLTTGDFIIANSNSVLRKVESDWLSDNHIIVDISTDTIRVIDDTSAIQTCLSITLEDVAQLCRSAQLTPPPKHPHHLTLSIYDPSIIGYEFLAGFLLGYSCIYNSPSVAGYSGLSTALTLQPLRKTTLQVGIHHACTAAATQLVIQEYTTPVCVLMGEVDMVLKRSMAATVARVSDSITSAQERVRGAVSFTPLEMTEEDVTSAVLTC